MLFDSSVRRELWRSFIGTLVVLLTVVLTMVLIRVLSEATRGAFAPADVSLILSYTVVAQLPILISLALFVSVVTVLSRFWRDSEMVIWQSSGVRQLAFIGPLLRMAWPVIAVVALCTVVARPWAQGQTELLKQRYERRSDMSRVEPGKFQSSADGSRVFFIDSHSEGQTTGRNVMMVTTNEQLEAVITAREGQLVYEDGLRYLVLQQGERTQTDLATGEISVARFETAKVLVGEAPAVPLSTTNVRSMTTPTLLAVPTAAAQGELVWRIGMVWAALNMVLAGLSLSSGNTRRHSSWNLVYALLLFVVYFNILSLTQTWVAREKMPALVALLGVHGGLTLAVLALIWWRDGAILPGKQIRRQAGPQLTGMSPQESP